MSEIRNWIADNAFRVFLKYSDYTQQQYFRLIYLQEERARKKRAKEKKEKLKKAKL